MEPSSAMGYLTQASVYSRSAATGSGESIGALFVCADADPHDGGVYLNWGTLLRQRGNLREARALFEKAVSANPHSPRGYQQLGLLHLDEYKWQKAEERLLKALSFSSRTHPISVTTSAVRCFTAANSTTPRTRSGKPSRPTRNSRSGTSSSPRPLPRWRG